MQLSSFQCLLLIMTSALCNPITITSMATLPLPVQTVYNFGFGAWIENLWVRGSGEILPVMFSSPNLYQVDPTGECQPFIVHTFPPPISSLFGITETTDDMFYVVAGNISIKSFIPVQGSFSIWGVDLKTYNGESGSAVVRKVTDIPEAQLLDGITTLNAGQGLLLVGDPLLGVVFRVDASSGQYAKVIDLPDMKRTPGMNPSLGVNGLKVIGSSLYYTSTNQQLFVRLPLNADGTPAGNPVNVNTHTGSLDDFDMDVALNTYAADNASSVILLKPSGGLPIVLAGGPVNVTAVPGATSAKFGRTATDSHSLYVGTTGGYGGYISGTFTIGGGISKIDVGSWGLLSN